MSPPLISLTKGKLGPLEWEEVPFASPEADIASLLADSEE